MTDALQLKLLLSAFCAFSDTNNEPLCAEQAKQTDRVCLHRDQLDQSVGSGCRRLPEERPAANSEEETGELPNC